MISHSGSRTVVLSLKQRWAAAIYDGAKTIEIRRRFPIPARLPQRALIYTSSPVKSLTGEASITAVRTLRLDEIARDWIDQTCVSREELEAYIGDLGHGTLISLARVSQYENPIPWPNCASAMHLLRRKASPMHAPASLRRLAHDDRRSTPEDCPAS